MTDDEKIKKFDEIQKALWARAKSNDILVSIIASVLITEFEIYSPDGEDPENS